MIFDRILSFITRLYIFFIEKGNIFIRNVFIYIQEHKREVINMAKTILMPNTVTDTYKNTVDALKNVDINGKNVMKKSLVQIMKQSFFHGACIYGGVNNFIA